jgi:hypothetical protein
MKNDNSTGDPELAQSLASEANCGVQPSLLRVLVQSRPLLMLTRGQSLMGQNEASASYHNTVELLLVKICNYLQDRKREVLEKEARKPAFGNFVDSSACSSQLHDYKMRIKDCRQNMSTGLSFIILMGPSEAIPKIRVPSLMR